MKALALALAVRATAHQQAHTAAADTARHLHTLETEGAGTSLVADCTRFRLAVEELTAELLRPRSAVRHRAGHR